MKTVESPHKYADATHIRAEREQLRNTGTAVKHLQDKLKLQIKEDEIKAVHSYNEYLKSLLSVHKECSETINWDSFAKEGHPKLPARQSEKQFEAEYNYQTYEPSFIDFVFLQNKNKIRELLDKVETAILEDDLIYNAVLKQFKADVAQWKMIQAITAGIKEADPAAFKNAIDFFDPYISISQLGTVLNCEAFKDHILVNVDLQHNEVLPDYVLSETDSGKLSSKKMETPTYNELCQDYIGKAAVRIARETFALLPVDFVIINIFVSLFNRENGRTEKSNILSVKFDADQIRTLNIDTFSSTKSITGLTHHMEFSTAAGFSATDF